MDVYLVDGTYELFRHFFALPSATDGRGQEVAAVRGVLNPILSMIEGGAIHIGVATDHVVESFRNDRYPGYKTSEGVPPELLSQFPVLEEVLQALGVLVWPMIEYEADDALASAARTAAQDKHVEMEDWSASNVKRNTKQDWLQHQPGRDPEWNPGSGARPANTPFHRFATAAGAGGSSDRI